MSQVCTPKILKEKCIYCGEEISRSYYYNSKHKTTQDYFTCDCIKCGAKSYYLAGIKNIPLRFTFPKFQSPAYMRAQKKTLEKIWENPIIG